MLGTWFEGERVRGGRGKDKEGRIEGEKEMMRLYRIGKED